MKTLIFLLFPLFLQAQVYQCTHKMSPFARWCTADVTVTINEKVIEVREVEGIRTLIEWDFKEDVNGMIYYSYKGSVVLAEPPSIPDSKRILTILKDFYICPVNQ